MRWVVRWGNAGLIFPQNRFRGGSVGYSLPVFGMTLNCGKREGKYQAVGSLVP